MKPCTLLTLLVLPLAACDSSTVLASGKLPLGQFGTLTSEDLERLVKSAELHTAFVPEAPLGITQDLSEVIPADNPMTLAKVELGLQLYFDARLSRDGTVACASCHHPSMGWTDNQPVSTGIDGQKGGRSAPTIVNRVLGPTQFWDGRAASLEEQALGPIGNPIEMGFSPEEAATRLNEIEGYRLQFEAVFGGPANPERIGKAIATFERTILGGESPFDIYERALPFFDYEPEEDDEAEFLARMRMILDAEEKNPMSAAALNGRDLFFGKAKCSACHVGQDLTDELFHNLGVGIDAPEPDLGRYVVTEDEKDRGAFKTPSVRNIASTAPYMHDGSLATLRDVVEHYDKGGTPNTWLSDKMVPLELTEQEKSDLVTFMVEGLSGQITPVEIPRLP